MRKKKMVNQNLRELLPFGRDLGHPRQGARRRKSETSSAKNSCSLTIKTTKIIRTSRQRKNSRKRSSRSLLRSKSNFKLKIMVIKIFV